MENIRNDQNQKATDKSAEQKVPVTKPTTKPQYPQNPVAGENSGKTDKSQQQNQTHTGEVRKDASNKPGDPAKTDQSSGSESFNPKHQAPEHQQNQKSNKDQVTNKDSDPSGSRDPKKQDNTVSSTTDRKDKSLTSKAESTMTDTKKQQNHNVDGSVIVEDEDEAAVISDDVEK